MNEMQISKDFNYTYWTEEQKERLKPHEMLYLELESQFSQTLNNMIEEYVHTISDPKITGLNPTTNRNFHLNLFLETIFTVLYENKFEKNEIQELVGDAIEEIYGYATD